MRASAIGILVACLTFTIGTAATWVSSVFYFDGGARYSYRDEGKKDAKEDLKNERFGLKIFGGPLTANETDKVVLLRDYRIELDRVAGCVIYEELMEYSEGYNEVMEAAIKQRFGEDYLKEAYKHAWEEHSKKYEITK